MDKSEKISWFEQLKIACLKPSEYKRLLDLTKGKVVLFLAAITLITTILGYGMDVAGFTVSVGGWKNFILNRLPAFELRDGTLTVDGEMDFEMGGVHFMADTSKDKVSTKDLSNKYQMELIFAKDDMVVKNAAVGNTMSTFSFKNMKNVVFNNQAMTSMVPMIHEFIVIMFFTQWIVNIVSYLTVCIFITMLVYFNQRTRLDRKNREEVSFGKIFKLSIYARVIFELVETIGVTAGSAVFSGTLWMFISYFGSYELLLAGFMRPEDRKKPDEML